MIILLIFVFLLITRTIFWGLVAYKTHLLEGETVSRQARGFIATQKYSALSFILESALWLMLVIPGTPLSLQNDSEVPKYIFLVLYALQLLPAIFVWLWWEGLIEATRSVVVRFQRLFGIAVVIVILTGLFAIIYAVLSSPVIIG